MTAVQDELFPVVAFEHVPHPGHACCDPTQDLAGWLAAERQAVDDLFGAARAHRAKAEQSRAARLRADVGSEAYRESDEACRGESLLANVVAQEAWRRFDRAGKVEAAHQFRLDGRPRLFEPPKPRLVSRRCARCGTESCAHFPDGAGHTEVQGVLPPAGGS